MDICYTLLPGVCDDGARRTTRENSKLAYRSDVQHPQLKLENYDKAYKEKYAYNKFYGKMTDYAKHLRTFGEMGVVCSISTVRDNT